MRITLPHRTLSAVACAWLALPALADSNKTLSLDVAGIKTLRIEASGGDLLIEGAPGGSIEVAAEIIGDERDRKLSLTKQGDRAVLISEQEGWDIFWFNHARVNLKVKLPAGLALDIHDGSGDMKLLHVAANTRIDDGSGAIDINDHRGNLDIDDGSGGIEIRGVVGNVRIDDGSGGIRIVSVDGHVTIDDGSGSIEVESVTKGLTLTDTGSGGVSTKNIAGGIEQR